MSMCNLQETKPARSHGPRPDRAHVAGLSMTAGAALVVAPVAACTEVGAGV